jgi:hypothetical protein
VQVYKPLYSRSIEVDTFVNIKSKYTSSSAAIVRSSVISAYGPGFRTARRLPGRRMTDPSAAKTAASVLRVKRTRGAAVFHHSESVPDRIPAGPLCTRPPHQKDLPDANTSFSIERSSALFSLHRCVFHVASIMGILGSDFLWFPSIFNPS